MSDMVRCPACGAMVCTNKEGRILVHTTPRGKDICENYKKGRVK